MSIINLVRVSDRARNQVCAAGVVTVTQITALYSRGEQKSISENMPEPSRRMNYDGRRSHRDRVPLLSRNPRHVIVNDRDCYKEPGIRSFLIKRLVRMSKMKDRMRTGEHGGLLY